FRGEDGSKVDLQDATVQVKIANEKALILEKTATVDSDNVVTFSLSKDDVTGHGDMRLEFHVTRTDGKIELFPADGWQKIKITPNLSNIDKGGVAVITVEGIKAEFQGQIDSFKGEVTPVVEEAKTKSETAEVTAIEAKTTAETVRTEFDAVVQRETDSDAMSA
ncbi:TPA: hypothetical protein ACG1DY_005105, partial [Escherichia coli]